MKAWNIVRGWAKGKKTYLVGLSALTAVVTAALYGGDDEIDDIVTVATRLWHDPQLTIALGLITGRAAISKG